jgi:glycosyltransferase involved in cell wall biosynthesis
MNLCLVCSEYPPGLHGGIGTATQLLARALVQAGHAVRVIGVYGREHRAPERGEDQGVQVWRLREPGVRLGWLVARYRLWRAIAGWVRAERVELVEVPDYEGWAAGWPRLPVPVVARLHGSATYFAAELGQPLGATVRRLERASLRRADFRCATSRYVAEHTARLFGLPAPDAILFNPVELPAAGDQPARSAQRVVFSGTLTPKKGVVSLVQAWPAVLRECPQAELHLYGKDRPAESGASMRAWLQEQLPDAARPSVQFHGHVAREELFAALATARLAVFPSVAEAFALAPLEAMARACPTIYTRRGSGPELIRHDADGWLVEPDRPDEIAAAIVGLLRDDALAARLGAAGQARVRALFAIDVLRPLNEAFYRRCLDAFAARAVAASRPA